MKEGTSAVLLQSGLDKEWWADSMECLLLSAQHSRFTCLDGKTPYERRFGVPPERIRVNTVWSNGRISLLFLLKDSIEITSIWSDKSCQVYSLDMCCHAGRIWKGEIMVADIEELEQMDASELYARRLDAKEVLTTSER